MKQQTVSQVKPAAPSDNRSAPRGQPNRVPARPSGRPQPAPFNVDKPDARVQIPRAYERGIFRGLGRVLGPAGALLGSATPLNEGEQEWIDRMRDAHSKPKVAPWVGDVRLRGYRGAEIVIIPGIERWRPFSVDIGPLVAPSPDMLPVPGRVPSLAPLPRVAPWYDPGHMPGEDWESDPMRREDWRNVPWLPDPRGPHRAFPPSEVSQSITVRPNPDGSVGVRLALHARAARQPSPQFRDTKYGRQLAGFFNAVVTKTYGLVSEVQDTVEIMAANTYALDRGKIVSAMDLERGSVLGVMRGYAAGEYRMDTVGFAFDFGINQLEDMGYAVTARAQMGLATKIAGDLGYKSLRQINVGVNMGEYEDVRTSWIRSSERWLSSWDASRSHRVSQLWR